MWLHSVVIQTRATIPFTISDSSNVVRHLVYEPLQINTLSWLNCKKDMNKTYR